MGENQFYFPMQWGLNPQDSLIPMPGTFGDVPSLGGMSNPLTGVNTLGNPVAPSMGGGGWFDSFNSLMGTKEAPGMLPFAFTMGKGLLDGFLGMQQYGLAKKQLNENKRQFNLNYDAQRNTVNSQLEDRQRARVDSNPGAYQSVGDYMSKYGIK